MPVNSDLNILLKTLPSYQYLQMYPVYAELEGKSTDFGEILQKLIFHPGKASQYISLAGWFRQFVTTCAG
jgi:hypothetical protein